MRNNCSDFEILISAAIDGELEPAEFDQLESHVDQCEHCRHEYLKLETVNDWLVGHDRISHNTRAGDGIPETKQLVETCARQTNIALPVEGLAHRQDAHQFKTEARKASEPLNSHRGRNFLACGMLAATAAGLAAMLTTHPVETAAPDVKFSDVSAPAERALTLNQQSFIVQASQTRVIEQELRLLRVWARNSSASPAEIELIDSKIEALMERTKRLEDTNHLSP